MASKKSLEKINDVEYITMRRLFVNSKNMTLEMYSPFPSNLEDIDYQELLRNKLIKTLDDFQKTDSGRCLSCGD